MKPADELMQEIEALRERLSRLSRASRLMQRIWGRGQSGDARLVRTVLKRVRRKLGDDAQDSRYIFTVPRAGYRMERGGTVE